MTVLRLKDQVEVIYANLCALFFTKWEFLIHDSKTFVPGYQVRPVVLKWQNVATWAEEVRRQLGEQVGPGTLSSSFNRETYLARVEMPFLRCFITGAHQWRLAKMPRLFICFAEPASGCVPFATAFAGAAAAGGGGAAPVAVVLESQHVAGPKGGWLVWFDLLTTDAGGYGGHRGLAFAFAVVLAILLALSIVLSLAVLLAVLLAVSLASGGVPRSVGWGRRRGGVRGSIQRRRWRC